MLICGSQIPLLKCHHHFIFSAINIVVQGSFLLTSRALVILDTLECGGEYGRFPKFSQVPSKRVTMRFFLEKKKKGMEPEREGKRNKKWLSNIFL